MKIFLTILVFLYSIASVGQEVRYDDGSYYNDDYIRDNDTVNDREPARVIPRGEPTLITNIRPRRDDASPPRPLRRRAPANSFQEVPTGNTAVGDFREVDSENPRDGSNGSR